MTCVIKCVKDLDASQHRADLVALLSCSKGKLKPEACKGPICALSEQE